MPYLLPKELAENFSMTDRTVYNRINKHPDEIKVKKEHGKTFIDEESFSKVFLKRFPNIDKSLSNEAGDAGQQAGWKDVENASELNKEHYRTLQRMKQLEKQASNFQEMANNHAILLREEKNEKKDLLQKYDALQITYNQKIEQFARKYYVLLGLFRALLAFIAYQYANTLWKLLGF